jgi:polyhydroxyalkanoate synthase
MMGGPVRFVLAESGHIAGIINHPASRKRGYWINDAEDAQRLDPDAWLGGATKQGGSWWVDWIPWLEQHGGALVAPPSMGNEKYPPIMDAPGTYVLEQ